MSRSLRYGGFDRHAWRHYWQHSFAKFLLQRFQQDRCWEVASSLSFTTLLSLVPLLTIVVGVLSAFPDFAHMTDTLRDFIFDHLTPTSAESVERAIAQYTAKFSTNAARLKTWGIVFLAITASLLMMTIESAFDTIWRVAQPRPLFYRLLGHWAMLTVGPVLIGASLTLTAQLMAATSRVPFWGDLEYKVIPLLFTTLAFSLLYRIIPNVPVRWRHALAGGILAAAVFELMKRGFGFYLAYFPSYELIYGAFAALPIFLMWIYLSWLAVLSGAVIVASLPLRSGRLWLRQDYPGHAFADAVQLLVLLCRAFRHGRPVGFAAIAQAVRVPPDAIETLLDTLAGAGYAVLTVDDHWMLARDPDSIRLADLYRLFVFAPADTLADGKPLQVLLAKLQAVLDQELQLTLADFAEAAEAAGVDIYSEAKSY